MKKENEKGFLIHYWDEESKGYKKDGCFYEDKEDLILTGCFGYCACGNPDTVLKHIHNVLNVLQQNRKISQEEYEEKIREIGVESYYFTVSALDKAGFAEHGSSLLSAWISNSGEMLQYDLIEIFKEENE